MLPGCGRLLPPRPFSGSWIMIQRAERRIGGRVPMTELTTLEASRQAADRIRPIASRTPLIRVIGHGTDGLHLKCENLQPAGAFKIRGAYNMTSQLTDEQRARGVITYSSGNHGQAVALAARLLNAPAVIV